MYRLCFNIKIVGMAGANPEVGEPTKAVRYLPHDEKSRPMSRDDFIKFLLDYDNTLNREEQTILTQAAGMMVVGPLVSGFVVKKLANRMSFAPMEKKKLLPFKQFPAVARWSFALAAATIPFMAAQEWCLQSILDMDDTKSQLCFNTKRYLMMQRGQMLFSRGGTREITKEEMKANVENEVMYKQGKQVSGTRNPKTDVNAALGAQQLVPVAQTGYQGFK